MNPHLRIAAIAAVAVSLAAACSDGTHPTRADDRGTASSPSSPGTASSSVGDPAAPTGHALPVVSEGGQDMFSATPIQSLQSNCSDRVLGDINKEINWYGETADKQPVAVSMSFHTDGHIDLEINLPNGEVLISGPNSILVSNPGSASDGWYSFSGTMSKGKGPGLPRAGSPEVDVSGKVLCASY